MKKLFSKLMNRLLVEHIYKPLNMTNQLFNVFLEHHHENWFKENMLLCLKNKDESLQIEKKQVLYGK